jgi:hypothetical protein
MDGGRQRGRGGRQGWKQGEKAGSKEKERRIEGGRGRAGGGLGVGGTGGQRERETKLCGGAIKAANCVDEVELLLAISARQLTEIKKKRN